MADQISIQDLYKAYTEDPKKKYCIKFPSRRIPTVFTKGGSVYQKEFDLPCDSILISEITTYDVFYRVNYLRNDGVPAGHYFPANLEGSIVEDKESEQMIAVLRKRNRQNLPTMLSHSGYSTGATGEIFVEDNKGAPIPAYLFSGGTGFSSEISAGYFGCLAWTIDGLQATLAQTYREAKKKFPSSRLSLKPVFEFPKEVLEKADKKHLSLDRHANKYPVSNAYGLRGVMLPEREVLLRTAGANIRFYSLPKAAHLRVTKTLDSILGVMCVSLFASFDDPSRRVVSGLPGDYRCDETLTSGYEGYEYRSLSNTWLCHPFISNLVCDFSRKCLGLGMRGIDVWEAAEEETISCMMNGDVKKAHEIMERNKSVINEMIRAAWYLGDKENNHIYDIFFNGLESAVKDPTDFVTNWNLEGGWVGHSDGLNKNVVHSIYQLAADKKFRVA